MFTNWADPQTFWLNVTDAALGVVMVAILAVFVVAIVREITDGRRRHSDSDPRASRSIP